MKKNDSLQETKYSPKISIIIVVYNGGSSIEKSILSVVNQTYKKIEFIIIDGGSTDDTVEIIKKYENKIYCWESKPDNGIYDAMNNGIKKATGDWVYFLGADDILFNIIEDIIPFFEKGKILYGNVLFKTTQKIYAGKFNSIKLLTNNIPHQAIFYPYKVFEKYLFNTKYKYFADYYLNLICWKDKSLNFKYIPFTIAEYNDTGLSTINVDRQFLDDQFYIFMNCMRWYLMPFVFIRKFPLLIIKFIKNNG
jgi:glycosyltransferase involved in cell wall biosynthesis